MNLNNLMILIERINPAEIDRINFFISQHGSLEEAKKKCYELIGIYRKAALAKKMHQARRVVDGDRVHVQRPGKRSIWYLKYATAARDYRLLHRFFDQLF